MHQSTSDPSHSPPRIANQSLPTRIASAASRTIPTLPDSLVTQILSHLLPPEPPFQLPTDLLSKPFQQRLVYLPPAADEMDKQLSPFPLPISTNALMERLQRLAVEHEVKPAEYAHDGESILARRRVWSGLGDGDRSAEEGVDLQFQMDEDDEWGFHGIRIPLAEGDGLAWTSDPESAYSSATSASAAEEEEPIVAHGAGGEEAGVMADYWAGFSPEKNEVELADNDEYATQADQEVDYWAQYSAGPSRGPSANPSRRPSGYGSTPTRPTYSPSASSPAIDSARKASQVERIASTLSALSPHLSPTSTSPLHHQALAASASRSTQPTASAGQQADKLLENRMIMKITSLLRRAWLEFVADVEREDEMEERAMAWLQLGRSLHTKTLGAHCSGGANGFTNEREHGNGYERNDKAKMALGLLEEMYSVLETGEEEGFYRLVEGAVRASGEHSGRPGLERRYSAEQQSYWE